MQLHPDQRQALESPVTVVKKVEQAAQYPVRRIRFFSLSNSSQSWYFFIFKNDNNLYEKVPLEAVPYSEEYGEHLETASEYLKEVMTSFWFSFVGE